MDLKNFTMKKYEDHLEKIILSKGLHTNIMSENRDDISNFEVFN